MDETRRRSSSASSSLRICGAFSEPTKRRTSSGRFSSPESKILQEIRTGLYLVPWNAMRHHRLNHLLKGTETRAETLNRDFIKYSTKQNSCRASSKVGRRPFATGQRPGVKPLLWNSSRCGSPAQMDAECWSRALLKACRLLLRLLLFVRRWPCGCAVLSKRSRILMGGIRT